MLAETKNQSALTRAMYFVERRPQSDFQSLFRNPQRVRYQIHVSCCKLLATLGVAACLCSVARADLISDGSFESVGGVLNNSYLLFTGSLGNGWAATQGEILVERGTLNGIPHSGSQFVYLGGDFAFNTLIQTLATTPGQSYTISLWVADSYPNLFQVSFGGQPLFNGTAPVTDAGFPATHYVQEVFTATATSATTTLSISGQWSSGTGTVLDDVSVVPVPEPGSLTLLGLPVLMAGFGLRKGR
jgi:hypothetical protein